MRHLLKAATMLGLGAALSATATAQLQPPVPFLSTDSFAAQERSSDLDEQSAYRSFSDAFGTQFVDETWHANGPHYHAEFHADRFVYLPALPLAPHDMPVTLSVQAFGRGTAATEPGAATVMKGDGPHVVRCDRPEFVETYEARQDGVKQSFVFDRLPSGSGDLVVRLRVETELDVTGSTPDGGLEFDHGDAGGVRIGGVVGFDASGRRTAGSMRYDNGSLELRLPARFVDTAELPLVLDPFVGTSVGIGGTSFNDHDADVTYSDTTDRYLVVWRRIFSGSSASIRGIVYDTNGTAVSGLIGIQSSGNNLRPSCATVETEDAFVIVWDRGGNIYGRIMRVSTFLLSVETGLVTTGATEERADVGGEATADNEALVVWRDVTANRIRARQVTANGSTSPPTFNLGTIVTVSTPPANTSVTSPAISKSGGAGGVHCIAWTRFVNATGLRQVYARVFSRDLVPVSQVLGVGLTGDNQEPDVDGDGRNWLVAWEWELSPVSGNNDIRAASIGFNSLFPSGSRGFRQDPVVPIADSSAEERTASVAWVGDSALVMYRSETGTSGVFDAFAQPVDLFTGEAVAPRLALPLNALNGDQGPAAAVSRHSGGDSVDGALIVWRERDIASNTGDIRGIRFRADDGVRTNLGGGCGTAGVSYAEAAMVGNANFAIRYRNTFPARLTWLVISPDRLDLGCGSCTLVPDPFNGFVLQGTADSNGSVDFAIPIPATNALAGVSFLYQWLAQDTLSPGCSLLSTDLSAAYRSTIQ